MNWLALMFGGDAGWQGSGRSPVLPEPWWDSRSSRACFNHAYPVDAQDPYR